MIRTVVSLVLVVVLFVVFAASANSSTNCGDKGIVVQILGSGGPEINDQRASTGYLIWRDAHARILIDLGPGSLQEYEKSGAKLEDLDVILISHLHVDHVADLPALIKGSFFIGRDRNLPLYGPTGNKLFPSTNAFVNTLFASPDGAFHYLAGFLSGYAGYKLVPHEVSADGTKPTTVIVNDDYRITAIPAHHGPIPALAWRVDIGDKSIVFSGDMNGDNHTLEQLAKDADLLVAHHAIPEGLEGVARNLHMPPSVIGEIAAAAQVKQLVLSHRMLRTIGREKESSQLIRKDYKGPLDYTDDGQCFVVR
jgi:ribonuclease BN (tRNA processing enzyme)